MRAHHRGKRAAGQPLIYGRLADPLLTETGPIAIICALTRPRPSRGRLWITPDRFFDGSDMRPFSLAMLVVALSVSLAIGAGSPRAHAQTNADFAAMCQAIQALDGRDGIRLGLVVHDLATGVKCEVRADESFRAASLYKLVVLAEAERAVARGELSFDDVLLIEPRHAIDDPVDLRPTSSFERAVGEAVRRMIQSSANADALALREHLGVAQVDSLPAAIGMESTRLGDEFVTTPDDIATYFEQLYRGELIGNTASASMLNTLSGQLLRDVIPEPLPSNLPIAHKTGTLDDYLHDAGIVFAPGGSYVLVAMSQHPFAQDAATELLREVSARVFQGYALPIGVQPLLPAGVQQAESDPAIAAGVIAGFDAGRAAAAAAAAEAGSGAPGPGTDASEGAGAPDSTSGFSLPGVSGIGVRESALGAITLTALAALLGVFTYGSRLRLPGAADYNREGIDAVAGGGEGTAVMRLGIRKADEEGLILEEGGALVPASDSVAEIEAQPVVPSQRLQRMAKFFGAQQHLLDSIRQQYEDEVQPLNVLLGRQAQTQHRLLANLETRLRPLNEFADGEEANLDALEQRMMEQGPDFIQRSFAEYLEAQRQRIADTRDQIDQQRLPLLQYGEEQRDAVEIALSRFDADVEALELNLAEQRKLLMRMLDAMRSDSFVAVKRFLEARESTMSDLAEAGITDPGQIGQSAQNLREAVDAMASQSVHIQSVLEVTDRADEQLADSVPAGPRALPGVGSFDDALAELGAADADTVAGG